MSITIQAVYEKGVLRPTLPLALKEGESVELTVVRLNGKADERPNDTAIDESFCAAAKEVFEQHDELLRRLS